MPDDAKLAEVLSEFARTLLTDFPIQAILDHLVLRIVEVLPISAAGVTLISDETMPRYVASSDRSAARFEELQTLLGEGPCVLAFETGEAVCVADMKREVRFPHFGPLAIQAGLPAVFTFPLCHGDTRLGALDLYCDSVGELSPQSMSAAQTLADVTSAYLLNARARSDLIDSDAQSRRIALHDSLTGLPNRTLFLERLDHAILRARRSRKVGAVLFLDVDEFKQVNDQFGHAVGDEVLVAFGDRIGASLRVGDTLARLSGDEFVVLCEDLDASSQVDGIAARIEAALAAPFTLSTGTLGVTASIGVACSGDGIEFSTQLVEDADCAMYQAKRDGGNQYQFIDRTKERVMDRPHHHGSVGP